MNNVFDCKLIIVVQKKMASNSNKPHPWFEICHPRPTAKYQVFIFPAAGSPGIILMLSNMINILFYSRIILSSMGSTVS